MNVRFKYFGIKFLIIQKVVISCFKLFFCLKAFKLLTNGNCIHKVNRPAKKKVKTSLTENLNIFNCGAKLYT